MEVFKKIHNVPCRLLNWGNPFSCDGTDVILCITGNPGIIDFYYEFCSTLNERTSLPVCLVGQAGHDVIPNEKPMVLKGDEHLFDLEGQLEHKLDLINTYIDKKSKLHLVGHSIGAWLIIEAIQKSPSLIHRISSIQLLFPTLQEMAVTKNGPYVNNILRKFQSLVMCLIVLLNMLPQFFLNFMAFVYLKLNNLPSHYSERILKYVDRNIIEKVLFLAFCEMDKVTKLNTDAIDKVKHLTKVIYGEYDGWVPLKYMEDLEQYQPPLVKTKVGIPHTFVLKSSEVVAEMVSVFIKDKQ